MRKIAILVFALLTIPAYAQQRDVWRPYDGPTGISCSAYNDAATLYWKTKGGDIGPVVTTLKQAVAVGKPNQFDVTSVAKGDGFAIKGNRIYDVSSREGAAPPKLIVTLADGATQEHAPIADVAITCSTTKPTGTSKVLKFGNSPILFFFPKVPDNAVKAVLEFTPSKSYSGAAVPTWTLHAVTIPRQPVPEPRLDGIASQYTNDEGIKDNPHVLFVTGLEPGQPYATRCPVSTPPVAGYQATYGNSSQNRIKGTAEGAKGTFEHCALPEVYFKGSDYEFVKPDSEYRELFVRLEIRFGSDYRDLVGDPGGKLPLGMASGYREPNTWRDYCGNGGMSCATGTEGWSARGGYNVISDKGNPAYPMVQGHQYIYRYQQPGDYGQHVPWGALGLFELDRWYTIEMQIVVNTPGQPDGQLRIWVDGKLSRELTNIPYRGPTTLPEITAKGGQQLIRSAWLTWFHGGKNPPSHTMHGWMDNIVVATSYIGPRRVKGPDTITFPGPFVCEVGKKPVCQ